MNEAVAQMAARRLAVDVANLTFRLALLEASRDEILEACDPINPDLWVRSVSVGDTPVSGHPHPHGEHQHDSGVGLNVLTITGVQADALERLMFALQGLL
jgi:hypothetical protein